MELGPQQIEEGLDHLEVIEDELEEIKDRTASHRRSFVNGMLQGAGALVGGILALVILGWALSLIGFIPGLSDLSHYLTEAVDNFNRRH